jgi:hypothetical protein
MNLIGKEHYMALTKDQLIAAAIEIPAKKVIKLVVAKGLTDAVNK